MRTFPFPARRPGRWAAVAVPAAVILAAAGVPALTAMTSSAAVQPASSVVSASSASSSSSAGPGVRAVYSPAAEPSTASLVRSLDSVPAAQRPTIVLVDGAWADTSSWNGEVTTLQAAGYNVRAIGNPVENLTTDSEYVADFLKSISGPIVLVGHSYGGAVITNAATGNPNVKALVYIDAAAPAPGETNGQLSGATSVLSTDTAAQLFTTTTYPGAPAGEDELYLNENIFVHNFANDLPVAQAEALWASQRGASTAAFDTPSKTAAWKTIPSWYFISTGDQIITPASELMMARRAHSTVTMFDGGSHLTLVSHPNAVTATIASAIHAVR
jgi:pimeloyl-ACP methyl ester carboxylesterase